MKNFKYYLRSLPDLKFMNKKNVVFLGLILLLLGCSQMEEKKPNVILIMIDDQGYGDIAAHGNEFIKTPNIDELYRKSARFTDYHVSPTCSPTRAAVLTGHHSNRTGVWHTVNGRSLILERETTMAQVFKDNGYNTAIFGKWHLGDNYPFRPQDKGFDEVLVHKGGGIGQTMDYWDNDYYDDKYLSNGVLKQYQGYCTDIWFNEAKQYISKQKNDPFFIYLASNTAHSPYFVDDTYSAAYRDNENIHHAPFYGMITNIDENIGKLIAHLEQQKLIDNTILIFTTDNGTAQGAKVEGHRLDGFVVKGNNAGMRGIKASMYEGGHRVPLYLHWKDGGIHQGTDINELTAHYDIFPTLVDLCKLQISPDLKFDGKSLVPLINGKNEGFKDRIVITNSQRIEVPEPWRRTSLMQANWRLVNGTELYDLDTDPEQRTNVAENFPQKMQEFKTAYDQWWAEIAPSYLDQPYIIIGHEKDNPTTLYCHDWHTEKVSPWHQRHIRTGYIDNGYWQLKIAESGTYNLKLRRWPEETHLAINAKAPVRPAIPGTSVSESKKSKEIVVQEAGIKIQDKELSKMVDPSAEFVEFTLELQKGKANLNTWFLLENELKMGAYFVSVEKLN